MTMLKIDIDFKPPKPWLEEWIETRRNMLEHLGYEIERISIFDTKRGIHAYIKIKQKISDEETNKLQFLLGDDHTRVKINQWRIKRGIKRWNKLFHRVLYRKKRKTVKCWYCGHEIPIIG